RIVITIRVLICRVTINLRIVRDFRTLGPVPVTASYASPRFATFGCRAPWIADTMSSTCRVSATSCTRYTRAPSHADTAVVARVGLAWHGAGQDVRHHVRVDDAVRAGARLDAAGVRADQRHLVLGRDHGEARVPAAPGVVQDVGALRADRVADLGAPGVDRD